MRVKVYVIELSSAGKRSFVLGGAVVLLLATSLRADANVPNTFTPGEVLSSAQMNANFAEIDAWQAHPVVTKHGVQFSLAAIYCGLTPSTTGQIAGGYAGAKSMCQTACSSASAHMCTGTEIVATAEAGVTVPFGSSVPGGWYSDSPNDCYTWTSGAGSGIQLLGPCWNNGADCYNGTYSEYCTSSIPILCCD